MALHKVLPFTVPAAALAGRRRRARPADVIPLRLRRRRDHGPLASALFAIAAVLLWGAGVVLGLATFRANREWMGHLTAGWPWWPIW